MALDTYYEKRVRTRGMAKRGASENENWLLIKKRDGWAGKEDLLASRPRSVLSGLTGG
jgi:hypothetical protein